MRNVSTKKKRKTFLTGIVGGVTLTLMRTLTMFSVLYLPWGKRFRRGGLSERNITRVKPSVDLCDVIAPEFYKTWSFRV